MKCPKCRKECREDSDEKLYEFKGECGGEPVWVRHDCKKDGLETTSKKVKE